MCLYYIFFCFFYIYTHIRLLRTLFYHLSQTFFIIGTELACCPVLIIHVFRHRGGADLQKGTPHNSVNYCLFVVSAGSTGSYEDL